MNIGKWVKYVLDIDRPTEQLQEIETRHSISLDPSCFTDHFLDLGCSRAQEAISSSLAHKGFTLGHISLDEFTEDDDTPVVVEFTNTAPEVSKLQVHSLHNALLESMIELGLYRPHNYTFLSENQFGRMRQYGIYKFACLVEYETSTEPRRGLDDIVSDVRAIPTVTIVSVVLANEKVSTGRYVAGLQIKFIPSYPGNLSQPEEAKAYILRMIKKIKNVKTISRVSLKLDRVE